MLLFRYIFICYILLLHYNVDYCTFFPAPTGTEYMFVSMGTPFMAKVEGFQDVFSTDKLQESPPPLDNLFIDLH